MSGKISLISLIKEQSVFIQHAQHKIAGSVDSIYPPAGRFETFTDAKEMLQALTASFSRSKVVTVCADRARYLYLKKLLFQALSLENEVSGAITAAIKSFVDDITAETAAAHALVPKGASVFMTDDGLFSGFAIQSGKQHLIVLPLDLERLDSIVENGFTAYLKTTLDTAEMPASLPADTDNTAAIAARLIAQGFCAAVAATRSAELIKIKTAPLSGWENAFKFIDCDEDKKEMTQKEYIANLALQARDKAGCSVGAAISNVFTDQKEDDSLFVLVTVADSLRARVAKVYAQPGETPRQLALAAVDTLVSMLGEYADAEGFNGFPMNTDETEMPPEELKGKRRIALKLIFSGIAAVILCLIIIFFGGRMVSAVKDFSGRLRNADQTQTVAALTDTLVEAESSKPSIDELLVMLADIPSYTSEESETTGESDSTQNISAQQQSSVVSTGKMTVFSTDKPITTAKITTTLKTTVTTTKAPTTQQQTSISVTANPQKTVKYDGIDYSVTEFLARTIAQEIGPGSPIEALKAQAVAAYTYAKSYNFILNGSQSAFSKTFDMNPNSNVVIAANAVAGKYLSYNGSTVKAFYFASCAGQTVSSESVWGGSVPYLGGGVTSPEIVDVSKNNYTLNNFEALVEDYNKTCGTANKITLQSNPADWLQIISADSAGYVNKIRVGNKEMSGNTFRLSLLKLGIRSHCFTFIYTPSFTPVNTGSFSFTVKGYGHGVGMSQRGAIAYANLGWTYDAILLHYYQPGVTIVNDI